MIIIDYEQNSQAWQEWRADVYGASDAAAMLDISPYKSRDALLHEKATGKSAPVSDWLQQLFAAGHAAEAAIMPELEARVGEPLYNLVGETDNHIAASFDGITYDQQTIVEHKLLRNSNASRKRFEMAARGEVAEHDMAQVQQQLLVSGAARCLFCVSDGTAERLAIAEIKPDPEWFVRLLAGWKQFTADLAAYAPNREDTAFLEAAAAWRAIKAQQAEIEEAEKAARQRLEALGEASGQKTLTGGGITLTRTERKGSVDYSKIPELQGIDLEPYRKAGSSYWKITGA